MTVMSVNDEFLSAKCAFTTRNVPTEDMKTIICGDVRPNPGDLVFASVEKIGSHQRLELPNGRRAKMNVGDRIIAVYGNRYAPDQFEALVGDNLGPCELAAAGGIVARKICKHESMKEPTQLMPLGLVGDKDGRRLNLSNYAVEESNAHISIPMILVAGTAMNAGKTVTSGSLIRGMQKAGYKVAGIKGTGTGAGGDLWFMSDMGAAHVLDFTDAGLASTYLAAPMLIERAIFDLVNHAGSLGCDCAVVEIADGLQHEETATLLRSEKLMNAATGMVFAAYDALGAQAGLQSLAQWGHNVVALSGQLTRSPLAVREAAKISDIPIVTSEELQSGRIGPELIATAKNSKSPVAKIERAVLSGPSSGSQSGNDSVREAAATSLVNGYDSQPLLHSGAAH